MTQLTKQLLQRAFGNGAGDTVANLTKAVGIKPCGGCKKRKEWLNKKLPYRKAG